MESGTRVLDAEERVNVPSRVRATATGAAQGTKRTDAADLHEPARLDTLYFKMTTVLVPAQSKKLYPFGRPWCMKTESHDRRCSNCNTLQCACHGKATHDIESIRWPEDQL